MAEITDDDPISPARVEQKRMGQALRALRERRGFTQAMAAERFNVSTQAWQRYESGERRLTEFKLIRLAEALGAKLEDLVAERAMLDTATPGTVSSLQERGRAFTAGAPQRPGLINELAGLLGPAADRTRIATSALSPWGESGEMVVFDRERPPRRDHGCVVELRSGQQQVWIFDSQDDQNLKVHSLSPERADHVIPIDSIHGVYAVRFRGD